MKINDLINNPEKLKDAFIQALTTKDKEMADLLVNYINDPYLIYKYAVKIAHGKVNDKLEDIIAQDAQSSYGYATEVLRGPFPKGEDSIAKNSNTSYRYARDVLNAPFPKGEDTIAKNAWDSFYYARDVLKGPFIKGEDAIIENFLVLRYYKKFLQNNGYSLIEFYQRHPKLKLRGK